MDLFGDTLAPTLDVEAALPVMALEQSEGLAAPRDMAFCLGHEAIEQQLLALFKAGRLPHGLIFSGLKGIGKATMAYRLARFLLKNGTEVGDSAQDALFAAPPAPEFTSLDVPFNDPVFRRVSSSGHPDLLTIERAYDAVKNKYKAGVAVDDIRKVAPFLRLTASNDGWRVVIIDDADTMNRNAQNALLKILEEPPEKTLLILVAHRMGALIPTIRSRAYVMGFSPLMEDDLLDLLQKDSEGLAFQQLEMLAELSEGSLGKALQYKDEQALEMFARLSDLFNDYPQWRWEEIHALADTLSRAGQEQSFKSFRALVLWVFAALIRTKARGESLNSDALDSQGVHLLFEKMSLNDLLEIYEKLDTHFKKVDTANLDKRQAILGLFSLIC